MDSFKFLSEKEIEEIRSSPPWSETSIGSPSGVELELGNRAIIAALTPYDAKTEVPYDIYKNIVDRHKYWYYDEPTFYEDYRKLWLFNAWAHMLVEYLLGEIFGDGFHFEGPGRKAVENFFFLDDTFEKIKNASRQTILLGNGFLDLQTRKGKLTETKVIDAESVRIDVNSKGDYIYEQVVDYLRNTPLNKKLPRILNSKRLIHLTLKKYPNSPYGVSLYRPNMHFLKGLEETAGDITAAIKRAAYSPIVVGLDLEEVSETERENVAKAYAEKMHKVQSAVTNYVIDKRHEMYFIGSKGGGGGQAMNMPVLDLINPLVAVCLVNFGMPLGLFLQQGANKAILREQKIASKKFIESIRVPIKRYLEFKLIPLITNRRVEVNWNDDLDTNVRKRKLMILEYQLGLISKEYYLTQGDIVDDGKTFFQREQKQIGVKKSIKKPRQEEFEPELEDNTIEESGE